MHNNLGKINKARGHAAEKLYANIFRELGYASCETSRLANKLQHDNAKIDLVGLPFNVQIKAGKQRRLNAGNELFLMHTAISAMFPQTDEVFNKPLILILHEYVEDGMTRQESNQKVFMSLRQYNEFLQMNSNFHYDTLKSWKFNSTSEFRDIVSVTFEVFKREIILKLYI